MSNKAIPLSPYRPLGVKYIAAALVVLASSASYAVEVVRWSPMGDLSYYRRVESFAGDSDSGIFHAYLAAALQSDGYRESARRASERDCDAWIALQRVSANSSRYAFVLFCRNGKRWVALRGGEVEEEVHIGVPSSMDMDDLLSRSRSVADGPRLGVGFDGMASYVTAYDGRSIGRFAVYGALHGESGRVLEFRLADGVVRHLEHSIELASTSAELN